MSIQISSLVLLGCLTGQLAAQSSQNISLQFYQENFDQDVVKVIGEFLYTTTETALNIYSIEEPFSSESIAILNTGSKVNDIGIYDTLLFIATAQQGIKIASISSPFSPHLIDSPSISGINDVRTIHIQNNRIFLAAGNNGFRIYEIQPNNSIIQKFTHSLVDYQVYSATSNDSLAFVSGKYTRQDPYWEIYEVSNLDSVSLVDLGFTEYLMYPNHKMGVVDDCLIYQHEMNFRTKQISTWTGVDHAGWWPVDIAISNNMIADIDADYGGINIYSLSTSCELTRAGYYNIPYRVPSAVALDVHNIYASVANVAGGRNFYILEYEAGTESTSPPSEIAPKVFQVFQNYPNPFNGSTRIDFNMIEAANIIVKLYSISGGLVANISEEYLPIGNNSILLKNNSWPSGVYFCQINSVDQTEVIKIQLLK